MNHLKDLKFNKEIDFNSEGFITQLVESVGKKVSASPQPHTFYFRITKANGIAPVLTTNYNQTNNLNSIFYGQIIYSSVNNSGMSSVDINLKSGTILSLKPNTGNLYLPNLLFDTIVNNNSLADVSANVYDLTISFTGYKFEVTG